jgi:DNA-binding PadR family transcriptional regulator
MRPSSGPDTSGFNGGFDRAFDLGGFDIRGAINGAVNELRGAFGSRMPFAGMGGHPDIRTAILTALLEQPMHGYQLIRAIEASTGWAPTPGEVYPTLQLLTDEGVLSAEQVDERKVYSLTDAGREEATAASADRADDAASSGSRGGWDRERAERAMALPKAGAKLARAVSQFPTSASDEQTERAVAILDEARRKLYAILAED